MADHSSRFPQYFQQKFRDPKEAERIHDEISLSLRDLKDRADRFATCHSLAICSLDRGDWMHNSRGWLLVHTYATLLKGNGEDVKVVQELMRHANISVTLNVYAQAITQTKRDAQSRVVSLLLDKNEEKPSTEAYRTVTDLQNSGGYLQVVDKVGVPEGIRTPVTAVKGRCPRPG